MMSAYQTIFLVSVAVAVISIGIFMLDDVLAELDRRLRSDDIAAAARRRLRQRHS
jgi:hypothetical protein